MEWSLENGNVNKMFRVPGLVTRPCDEAVHNFTIVELQLQHS
jgi:hypothetical protein